MRASASASSRKESCALAAAAPLRQAGGVDQLAHVAEVPVRVLGGHHDLDASRGDAVARRLADPQVEPSIPSARLRCHPLGAGPASISAASSMSPAAPPTQSTYATRVTDARRPPGDARGDRPRRRSRRRC
jgi:hypothetical protein